LESHWGFRKKVTGFKKYHGELVFKITGFQNIHPKSTGFGKKSPTKMMS